MPSLKFYKNMKVADPHQPKSIYFAKASIYRRLTKTIWKLVWLIPTPVWNCGSQPPY